MGKYVRATFFALALVGMVPYSVFAVDTKVLTDAQISAIQANCNAVKVNLELLHGNDAVFYVNMSQRYNGIAQRLMAPMNSRIALNGMDGVALTKVTVEYNEGVQAFTRQYAIYEKSLQRAIDTDCQTKPVEFYSAVSVARVNREDLADVVSSLYEIGGEYSKEVALFKKTLTASEAQ